MFHIDGTDYMGRTCGQDNKNESANVIKIPYDIDCINSDSGKNTTAMALCEQKVKPLKTDLSSQAYLWFMEVLDPFYYGGIVSSEIIQYFLKNLVCELLSWIEIYR